MNRFRQIPFLRILLPFILGILLSLQLERQVPFLSSLFFILFALVLVFYFFFRKSLYKTLYLFVCDGLLFVFGMYLVQEHTLQWDANYYGRCIDDSKEVRILAQITDVPSEKAKTVKTRLRIVEVQQYGETYPVKGNVIAYFKKHRSFKKVKAGQTLCLQTRLVSVESPLNPQEFNYKRYLYNRQIYHVAFVDSTHYSVIPAQTSGPELKQLALQCKQWLVERLKNAGLNNEAYAICSALLAGYDEDIGQDILKAFAHSGTLHVLSVSGLHTGLIFVFLSFVFDLFDRRKKFRGLKFSLLLAVLWAFALLTGLEAPVLRSVLMLSLFAVGSIFYRNEPKNQLNLLFVSAFVLLCANPYYITEIGFQLSFAALLGLIVFEPFISGVWQPEGKLTIWVWKSISASFAATLSTLPFTLLYFKQFPLWFFVANLIVVPASFLLLLLAIPALFHWKWVVLSINLISDLLIKFITLFNSGSWTNIEGIHFTLQDAFWLFVLILLFSAALHNHSFKQLQFALLVFAAWQVHGLFMDLKLRNKQLVTVYSIHNAFAYTVKDGGRLFYSVSDSAILERYLKPHAVALGNPKLNGRSFNCVVTNHAQLLFLNSMTGFPEVDTQKATYLILSANYNLKEEDLRRFTRIKAVVLDQSVQRKIREGVEKLCRKFGLLCFDTRKQGAFIFSKDEIENWR